MCLVTWLVAYHNDSPNSKLAQTSLMCKKFAMQVLFKLCFEMGKTKNTWLVQKNFKCLFQNIAATYKNPSTYLQNSREEIL